MRQQESITRKKLYKAGKSWVVAATMFAAMGTASVTTVAHADVQQDTAVVATNSKVGDDTTKSAADTNTVDTKAVVETAKTTTATDKATDTNATTDKKVEDAVKPASTDVADKTATDKATDTNATTDKKVEEAVKPASTDVADKTATDKAADTNATTDKKVEEAVKPASTDVAGKTATDKAADTKTSTDTSKNTTKKVADKKAVTAEKQEVVTGGHYEAKGDGFVYISKDGKQLTGLQNIDGNVQYFGTDGLQVKGQFVEANGKTIYLDPNSGNAVANTQKVNGQLQGYDAQGNQVKKSFSNDASGNTYYFDDSGKMLTGLQSINGKSYYLDEQGHLKKNYAGIFNKQFMYFDAETGVGKTTIEYQFEQGLTSQNNENTPHNAAKSYDAKSFENVDGFLTADTWYRPTDILKDGQTWTASSDSDLRPLLMTWWPDKETQVSYLNYMQNVGLNDQPKVYTVDDSQNTLNEAAIGVQANIERKITLTNNTAWLRSEMEKFVNSRPAWNIDSENPDTSTTSLTKGFVKYLNNDATPDQNSKYRLFHRVLANLDGSNPSAGGFELLLANDVDNSNPVVQAEQLNWLYYLMNFGSITANDKDANFDSIRIDAVGNVDADLLKIAGDYFKQAYQIDQSDKNANQHISILENWDFDSVDKNAQLGNNQLTMDANQQFSLVDSLTNSANNRKSMLDYLNHGSLVSRKNTADNGTITPNYSFIRAHDSKVQENLASIISMMYPGTNGFMATQEQVDAAFKKYNEDEFGSNKVYTLSNLPSAYSLLLTNKDTIPRVYYGDLYTDNGKYMAEKTPYFEAIDALMKARIKYVAGGQSQHSGDEFVNGHDDILTSVRYGKGIDDANTVVDKNAEGVHEGIGVVISNNPNLNLANNEKVILNMGKSHANQDYRALLLTTKDGLKVYNTDTGAPVLRTNSDGQLILGNDLIYGVENVQVSGYLGAWVPVGAASDQDARTQSTDTVTNDGSSFHSNDSLDSQLIYEGFSNFQEKPTDSTPADEYTNAIIAKPESLELFKSWGVTSFQLAPQYRSSQDGTFIDSTIDNGYAFTDRYDLGFDTPTKYGNVQQLRDAIKALHSINTINNTGIQVMADWVPDQLYNFPDYEVVAVNKSTVNGDAVNDSELNDVLYAAKTKGGGKYQAQYGGEYLSLLQSLYPTLFSEIQATTGEPIDPSVKIKEWSAKYLNGSSLQGRGAHYVLKDWASNQYFNIAKTDEVFLPLQLMNKESNTGFTSDATGVKYYSTSGYQAKDTFIEDGNGNWYYFDDKGYMARSQDGKSPLTVISTNTDTKNGTYYFMPNGVELRDGFGQDDSGNTYYFDKLGKMVTNQYIFDKANNTYHVNSDGTMSRGLVWIDNNLQYFAANGVQLKGVYAKDTDNKLYYFDANTGNNDSDFANKSWQSNWTTNDYIAIERDAVNTIGVRTDYTAYISSAIRQDGIYKDAPLGTSVKDQNNQTVSASLVGNTSEYNHQKVQVSRQYTDSQGVVWNLINFENKTWWVDSNALVTVNFTSQKPTKHFVQFGMRQGKYDGFYLSAPYKQTESKWVASTRTHQGQLLEVVGQYTTGSGSRKVTWYLVGLDGKQVWVDSRAVGTNFSHKTNINLLINSATRNDGMYLNAPYGQKGYKRETSSRFYNEKLVTVSQQYYDNKGVIWNLITLNGKQLWVDSRAFASTIEKSINQKMFIDSSQRNDGMYLNAPYRAQGAKRSASTKTYNGQLVQVTKQRKDSHGVTWYLATVNNQTLWVDSRAFATVIDKKVNQNLYINSRNDGMYLNAPYRAQGAKRYASTKTYTGQRVQVTLQRKDTHGVTWYLTKVDGKQLWVDSHAFAPTFTRNVSLNVKVNSSKRNDGIYLNAPYGNKKAKRIASTKAYNGKRVKASKEYKDAKGVTWYLVNLNNKQVWIDKRAF
ncbi:glycoside hydrolase family 70 protein [Leuconostoc fallax]|uniref:glycoside hydrolase family 70 protein n=1 Tax=Leuconostoc fallax TaxID=1251 RepID=UPI001C1EFFCE|nr:glycoside hydrolase family 70 protein [Leuconostoc fallax]MBU7456161.1 SH3-like domain-containing protein [Leuconostoc fallax]